MKFIFKPIALFFISTLFTIGCQKEIAHLDLIPPVADAGVSHNIKVPSFSDTLRGTGTTTNGNITGFLWSLVSGPNVPVIVSPGLPTTIINGLIAGTYIFQLIVFDEAGLTGVDTVEVMVSSSVTQTLTAQPSNSANELTLWLYDLGNYSDPISPELDAVAWTNGGATFDGRDMFKFDMSSIPTGANIISAKLSLFSNHSAQNGDHINANAGINNAMYIERITNDWTSTTLWQNQPLTDTISHILIPHTDLPFFDLVDVDVTSQGKCNENKC